MQKKHSFWKSLIQVILTGLLIISVTALYAQNNDEDSANIWVFHYMKSNSNDYVAMEREVAKPIHMERVEQDKLVFWGFYQVEFPTGTSSDYNYMTLEIYRDADQYANRWENIEEIAKTIHPGKNVEEIIEGFGKVRDLVSSEMFGDIDKSLTPSDGTSTSPTRYIVLNRMKVPPGGGGAYVAATTKIFKPFFRAAAEAGAMVNWWLLGRIMPRGTDHEHTFITLDLYPNLQQAIAPDRGDAWQKAHGDKTMSELLDGRRMVDLRTMTSADLLRKIDSTTGN